MGRNLFFNIRLANSNNVVIAYPFYFEVFAISPFLYCTHPTQRGATKATGRLKKTLMQFPFPEWQRPLQDIDKTTPHVQIK